MVFSHGCSGERMRSGSAWTLYMVCPWMLLGKQETTSFFTRLFPARRARGTFFGLLTLNP